VDHEVGQCLRFENMEANVFVIVTNKNTTDHFSYGNLEKGLIKIKTILKQDCFQSFIIYNIKNHKYENLVNQKIVSLICSTFLD